MSLDIVLESLSLCHNLRGRVRSLHNILKLLIQRPAPSVIVKRLGQVRPTPAVVLTRLVSQDAICFVRKGFSANMKFSRTCSNCLADHLYRGRP